MKKCIITVGVSASGKTTWTTEFINERLNLGEQWVDINRDVIRRDIFNLKSNSSDFNWNDWKWKWEKEVKNKWNLEINYFLSNFDSLNLSGIVISDTNLNPSTRAFLETKFKEAGFEVEYKFFPISFEEAVKRDRARKISIGHSAIAEQLEKYNNQFGEKYTPDKTLPKTVLVDIDGTLAKKGDRNIFDWEKVDVDFLNEEISDILWGINTRCGYCIVLISGRDESCRDKTEKWVKDKLSFSPNAIFMRPVNDMRKDYIVKKELFNRYVRNNYNVRFVIDDRPVCCRLWMNLGIKTFICGNPWIEF